MPTVTEMKLNRSEVRAFPVDEAGLEILCVGSVLWITQTEDSEDYILLPGERFTVTQPCRVVVQGLKPRSDWNSRS